MIVRCKIPEIGYKGHVFTFGQAFEIDEIDGLHLVHMGVLSLAEPEAKPESGIRARDYKGTKIDDEYDLSRIELSEPEINKDVIPANYEINPDVIAQEHKASRTLLDKAKSQPRK